MLFVVFLSVAPPTEASIAKPVFNKRRFAKTSGLALAKPAYIMADPVLGLILGESGPAGEYRIIGIAEDLTCNKIYRTSIGITLGK